MISHHRIAPRPLMTEIVQIRPERALGSGKKNPRPCGRGSGCGCSNLLAASYGHVPQPATTASRSDTFTLPSPVMSAGHLGHGPHAEITASRSLTSTAPLVLISAGHGVTSSQMNWLTVKSSMPASTRDALPVSAAVKRTRTVAVGATKSPTTNDATSQPVFTPSVVPVTVSTSVQVAPLLLET